MPNILFTVLLAQESEPARQSMIGWAFRSLGLFYGFGLPFMGLVLFVGAVLVVVLSRRPAVIAAYLVFVPLPFLVGIFGSLQGFISAYSVIATSTTAPQPADVAIGISTGLFSSLVGLLMMFPAYFVVAVGLFLWTAFAPKQQP